MAIYTKTGDGGDTKLVGGISVRKSHPRVDAYGTTDELCSQVGFVLSLIPQAESELRQDLIHVQQLIFACSSDLAVANECRAYKINLLDSQWLEPKIDDYWAQTPTIKKFILPGGDMLASSLHIARCLTRKAERKVIGLVDQQEKVNPAVIVFLNRLSDYFFALARFWNLNKSESGTELIYAKSPTVFRNKPKEQS